MTMCRLRITALFCISMLLLPPAVTRAEEITPEQRTQLERARSLVEQGLTALAEGRADDAVDLLQQSRTAAPFSAVPAYDHALALARSGEMDKALVAYRDALAIAPADVRAAVSSRARHNLSGMQLDLARGALQLVQTPGAIEQAVRAQPGPDGEPLTDAMATTLAMSLRRKVLDDGLNAAKDAVAILRDSVREALGQEGTEPSDAVRNLVLAQRARRALEAEVKNQQQSEQDEQDESEQDNESQDDQEGEQGDEGKSGDEGDEEKEANSGDDEQEQKSEEKPGDDGESSESDDSSAEAREGDPRDVGKEEAERMLERLLDAAALKARQVEEMKAARLRRGAVEKDW